MAAIVCPGSQELKQFILGQSSGPSVEQVAEHIEGCASCQGALRDLSADDTLVEAIRAKETLGEGPEQESVHRLVAKIRSLLPEARRTRERAIDGSTPSGLAPNGDTIGVASDASEDDDGFAPAQAPDEIGRLACYRVLKLLGVGGMGKVFLAEDLQLRRKVALKVMKPDLARNPKAKQRFLQEARLAAAIEHDHIVHIYQVGEDLGIPFLAMQLLNGISLEDVLQRKSSLTHKQIIRIGSQIAEGLAAAHERGLIHRDIKPANIWIEPTGGGRVKILDFGLARNTADDISLTQSGAVMGTPAYMPPEQARGDKVDHRCDLYSLGCVLYRMATGDLPIKGNDTMAMLMALALHDPIAPTKIRDDLPPALSELIMQLLAKERDKRPATAKDVVTALKKVERSLTGSVRGDIQVLTESVMATPPMAVVLSKSSPGVSQSSPMLQLDRTDIKAPSAKSAKAEAAKAQSRKSEARGSFRRFMPLVGIGALAACLLIGIVAAGVVFYIQTANGVIRIEVDDPKVSFKVDDKGNYTIVGGDAKELSFAAGEHALKFKNGDMEFETDKFTLKRNDKVVVKVEFLKGKLQVVQNDKVISQKDINKNGPPNVIVGAPIPFRKATWVPDKTSVALPGLIPYPALRQGVGRWQIMSTSPPDITAFAESPDGRWVAVWRRPFVLIHDAQTGALSAVGKETTSVGGHHLSAAELKWSPDSKWVRTGFSRGGPGVDIVHIFAVDGTLSSAPYMQHTLEFGWNPKHPIYGVVVAHVNPARIELIDPAKPKAIPLKISFQGHMVGAWSPDGESLLIVNADKTAQLFGRDGNPGIKLEGAVEPSATPVWTADGATICALSAPDEVRFWTKEGKGGKTFKHDAPIKHLQWHAEAKVLAVASDNKTHFVNLDGIVQTTFDVSFQAYARFVGGGVTQYDGYWPKLSEPAKKLPLRALSPDAKYAATNHPGGSVGMAKVKNGELVELDWRIPLLGEPRFSHDGKRLFAHDMMGLAAYDIHDAKKVTHFGGPGPGHLVHAVFSPKGDKIAVGSMPGYVTVCDPLGQPIGKPLSLSDDPTKSGNMHPGDFWHLSWHPDGRHLLAIAHAAVLFDVEEGKRVASLSPSPGNSAAFAPDTPDHIIFTSPNGTSLWRWKVEREPSLRVDALGQLVPSPDGKVLLTRGMGNGTPIVISTDLKTRTPLAPEDLKGPALCWLPDGKHFLAGTNPLTIRSLDGALVETINPVDGVNTASVEKLQLSPDGKSIVGHARGNNRFFLLNLADKRLSALPGIGTNLSVHYGSHYFAAVFSPDGKYLILPEESTLTYWNLATKELEQIVLFLPDGQHVIVSPAGEVLARSKNAEQYYRYLVEDKTGRLHLKSAAEFERQ